MSSWHRFVLTLSIGLVACSGKQSNTPKSPDDSGAASATAVPEAPEASAADAAPAPAAPLRDRAAFARAMAKIEPGTNKRRVVELLGEPDDVRTEKDPGGITAARTREIWRYGTDGHLSLATLGSVHIQADDKVQYVFGGRGEPPAAGLFDEATLRRLLRILDRVPSYNAGAAYDPLAVIRAVNALQPLGREKAIAAIAEYLRISSSFENPGREGAFLVMRCLFDVPTPPGHMPPMMVGAGSPAPPTDATLLPRFPIAIRGDIPFMLVGGYALGGMPEQPEHHLDYFRKHGVVRSARLRPLDDPLALVDGLVGKPTTRFLSATGLDANWGRARIVNQFLLLIDNVYRGKADIYGQRFGPGNDIDARWQAVRAEIRKLRVRWDEATDRYVFADGSSLPPRLAPQYQREIWELPLAHTTEAKLILERQSADHVRVELRVSVGPGQRLPAANLRLVAAESHALIAELDLPGQGKAAPASSNATWSTSGSGAGIVQSRIIALAEGKGVVAELVRGKKREKSSILTP